MPATPRYVTWRTLLLSALALFIVLCIATVVTGYWVWHHVVAEVDLPEQTARVALPSQLAVRAAVTNNVQVRVRQVLPLKVPLHQTLSIPVPDPLQVDAQLQATIPLDLNIPVEQTLHVDQTLELNTAVKTRVLGFGVTLPIQGKVPLKLDVPIHMLIPVRQQLPLQLRLPASVQLTQPLQARLDTVLDTRVAVDEALNLPVTAPVDAVLSFPQRDVEAGLRLMRAEVPLQAIRFETRTRAMPAPEASPASHDPR